MTAMTLQIEKTEVMQMRVLRRVSRYLKIVLSPGIP